MVSFKLDPEEWERLDWRLLQNSAIALYYDKSILEADVAWLVSHEYRVVSAQVKDRQSSRDLLAELGTLLAFPAYYGRSLDAFNDCLSDVDVPLNGGLALVLHHFDLFARLEHSLAQALLDICADNSRRFLLTGRRFIVLLQSDDPGIAFGSVGSTPVMWNPHEHLASIRRA